MSNADIRKMIKELLADDSDRLTAWECEFLDSINRQVTERDLSDKQVATLERIWDRIFS